jgi:hypothetical protein
MKTVGKFLVYFGRKKTVKGEFSKKCGINRLYMEIAEIPINY